MKTTGYQLLILALVILASCKNQALSDGGEEADRVVKTLRLYPENPRYLEYKGEPILLITSAEHYGALVNLDFDYERYLETLAGEGFNYTRIFCGTYIEPVKNIFGIEKNTLAPVPGRYIAPWIKVDGKYDLDHFNTAYFERLRDFLSLAEQLGIIVEATLFTSIYHESAWILSPLNAANNVNETGILDFRRVNTLFNGALKKVQERFIRKVVRELNGFDNLFFEIQNEPWADNPNLVNFVNSEDKEVFNRAWQKEVVVANGVAKEWHRWVVSIIEDEESKGEKKHLIAQNISNFQHPLEALPEGVSMINFHYAHPEAVLLNLGIGGVVGLDETGFMPHEDQLYINQAWRFVLSGGGLYNNLDYSFTADHENGTWSIPAHNPGWGGPPFRKKLSYIVETIKRVPFHEMEFSNSLLKSTGTQLKQYGLQKSGEYYLLFMEHYNGLELIPEVPSALYKVEWLNVDTGDRQTEHMKLGDMRSISAPFREDQVVLLIQKIEQNNI